MKRIIIAGGGTGGHFYPVFSLVKKIISHNWQILFVIKKNDISLPILKNNDIPYIELDMEAFPRSINIFKHIIFIYKLTKSILYSLRIINDFEPAVILGSGSYVAFPVIFSGWLKNKKTLIHESNAILGISNYLAGFFSQKILAGMGIRNNPFPHKTILTGTPIRESFYEKTSKVEARKKLQLPENEFLILVFGGSQGAKIINEAFYRVLLDFATQKMQINFIQIAGEKNYQELKEKYEKAKLLTEKSKLFDYYENMPLLYSACDIVISRSGSSTITELIYMKKPAILIPLKTAAANHQEENAQVLLKHGCAIIIRDNENLIENLKRAIHKLFNSNNLSAMIKAYERIEIPSGELAIQNILFQIEN